MADNVSMSSLEAVDECFDMLIKSRFIEMFGSPDDNRYDLPVETLSKLSVGKLTYGIAASAIDYDGKTRYIRITDIDEDGNLNDDYKSPDEYDEKYLLNDGDILFARSGATVGKTFQYSSIYGQALYAGYLIRSIPDVNKILPEYLFYATKSAYYIGCIETLRRGATQPNINAQQYGSIQFLVPPLNQQESFVNFVQQVKKSKTVCKQIFRSLDNLVKSRFIEMFGHNQYEEKPLNGLFKTSSGGTPLKGKREYYDGGNIPWLTSGEVNNEHITEAKSMITELALQETSAKIPPLHSVLVSMYGSIGYAGILEFDAAINQAICAIHPSPDYTPEWVCHFIRYKKNELVNQGVGAALTNISQEKIRKLMVPLVPLSQQEAFTALVHQVDKSKFEVIQSLTKLMESVKPSE